jgi:hypothetical protein
MSRTTFTQEDADMHFKAHKATFEELFVGPQAVTRAGAWLKWAKADGSNYSRVDYILHRNTLLVYGDLGDAVYSWSEAITLKFLADCDFGYFSGKCQASETGRNYVEWSEERAKKWIAIDLKEYADEYDCMPLYRRLRHELDSNCHSKGQWEEHLRDMDSDDRHKLFGSEWYEHLDVGMQANFRCWLHWKGIQMAWAQIQADAVTHGNGD